jgi:hypothetical protein
MGALMVTYSFFEWQLLGMPILSENGDNSVQNARDRQSGIGQLLPDGWS